MSVPTPNPISGIAVAEIRNSYVDRGLGSWSDAKLIAGVAEVVALPRNDPADSFILHAPLELAARAGLLPLVGAEHRELARLHIVAIAAKYQESDPLDLGDPIPLQPGSDPVAWLGDAIAAGDLGEVDRAAVMLAADLTARELVASISDLVIPLTGAAAHAPIFLYHLARLHPLSGVPTNLLRPLCRELARRPGWRIGWADSWRASEETDGRVLSNALANTPLMGVPGTTSIHPLMMQVDESGLAAEHLGPALGRYSDDAAQAVLRTAARSMLADTPKHAPYGWTHCLTMPQAVVGIAHVTHEPERALAIAATHVAAFRAGLGTVPELDEDDDNLSVVDPSRLASTAATSHDAHIAKYVLACFDAAKWDPAAAPLYLAAGQRLLDVWDDLGGDPTDPFA